MEAGDVCLKSLPVQSVTCQRLRSSSRLQVNKHRVNWASNALVTTFGHRRDRKLPRDRILPRKGLHDP